MNTQLSELLRLLTNLIRIGTISEVDTENGLCRVQTGGARNHTSKMADHARR